jgi:hypothetical protein
MTWLFGLLLAALNPPPAVQTSSVPQRAAELSAWLERDESRRTWLALSALSGSEDEAWRDVLREHVLARVPPEQLEKWLAETSAESALVLDLLSERLASKAVSNYVVALARSRSNRLGDRGGPWSEAELESIATLQFVDPQRFLADERFRATVIGLLPRAIGERAPRALRDQLLFAINNVPGIDFEASEAIEWGWHAIERPSGPREIAYDAGPLAFPESPTDPIIASIYSLSSSFVNASEAVTFLEQIRDLAPARQVVVLVDLPLRLEIEETARRLHVQLEETYGRHYSAWPRDPFSLVRDRKGNVVVLLRPNTQRGRGEDLFMGRELIQGLPEALDRAWGKVRWALSPVPFHNGQVLLTKGRAWLSLHSLEPHVLRLLGLERVPVENFDTLEGWRRYAGTAQRAANELSTFYGREAVFVHELDPADSSELSALTDALGGGAGFDLDSLVTLLETDDGRIAALVGDIDEGRRLLTETPLEDLHTFRTTFRLDRDGETLRRALMAAQATSRARGLDNFLELVSRHLSKQGLTVLRLPLFFVPVPLLENRAEFHHQDFLITWNNVVTERPEGSLHAEGFSQGLKTGDARAREAFRAVGYELDLISPLVRSIVLVGGYRCASQHLR